MDGEVLAEPVKPAVISEIEAGAEENSPIIFSADNRTPEPEAIAESESAETKAIMAEEKREPIPPTKPMPTATTTKPSSDPKPGTIAIVDGERCMWIPGFGWIDDNGGGNVGTVAEDMYENGNKIGIMD